VPPFAPRDVAGDHEQHVDARDRRRDARPGNAERRHAETAEDEEPARRRVHEIGGEHGHHDRPDGAERLQIPSHGREEEQGQHAPRRRAQVRNPAGEHRGLDARRRQQGHHAVQHERQQHAERGGEQDAVDERMVRVAHPAAAHRGRDDVVEPEQHPEPEDRDAEEDRAADADGTDRLGAETADDDRVDEPHRRPSDLGGDHGSREAKERAELARPGGDVRAGHARVCLRGE
jgi:hypothetical protein